MRAPGSLSFGMQKRTTPGASCAGGRGSPCRPLMVVGPPTPASTVPRLRRLPAPLVVLLAVTLLEGLAWTFANPPLQNADEGGHVAYVQKIVDDQSLPWRSGVSVDRD